MAKVGIVTDTIACLPRELVEEYGIKIVPINIIFEDKVYRDEVDITPSEVYRLLKQTDSLPTTSAPSPSVFLEAYRELSQSAESILCLSLPPELTMVLQSATLAKEMAKEELPDMPIEVVDCRTAAGAQGLIVLAAARAAAAGKGLDEVIQVVQDMIPRVHLIVMLDTLYYLASGGRIPTAAAWAGSLLKVKPFVTVSQGKVRLVTAVRTKRRGVEHLLEMMGQRTGANSPLHVIVMHADALEEAEDLKQRVASEFDCAEIYVKDFTPVMGIHTGPGLLGLAFYAEG